MESKFIQETCIGYNFGSLISVGIADIKRVEPTVTTAVVEDDEKDFEKENP